MNDLLVMMGTWSPIAIYALFAGVFGGGLALIGGLLEKATGIRAFRWAPVLGVALSSVFVREGVLPAVTVAYANKDLPRQIDEVTVLDSFELQGKKYIYNFVVSETIPADFDPSVLKRDLLADVCTNLRPEFQAGALETAEYRYRRGILGEPKSFYIHSSECQF